MDILCGAVLRRALWSSIHVSTGLVSTPPRGDAYTTRSQRCAIHHTKLQYMACTDNEKKRLLSNIEGR